MEALRAAGVQIISVANEFSLDGPAAEVILALMSCAANMEKLVINERIARSGINWGTPTARHSGADITFLRRRRETCERAKKRNPGRWAGSIRTCEPAPPVTLNPARKRGPGVALAA